MATVLAMPETKESELQTEQFPLEAEAFEGQPQREGEYAADEDEDGIPDGCENWMESGSVKIVGGGFAVVIFMWIFFVFAVSLPEEEAVYDRMTVGKWFEGLAEEEEEEEEEWES